MFPIALLTGDLPAAERCLEMYLEDSKTLLSLWRIMGQSMRGALLIKRGELSQGVTILRAVFDTLNKQGWDVSFPDLLGVLAEGLAGLGQNAEALGTIAEALTREPDDPRH
jgi:hypothetical protein